MIYLKLEKEPNSIEEVFNALFSFCQGVTLKSVKTYKDKECREVDCEENKYRSIDDLIEIVQTYFPEATEGEIIFKLANHTIEARFGNDQNSKVSYSQVINCGHINKPTVCFRSREHHSPVSIVFASKTLYNSKFQSIEEAYVAGGFNSREEVTNHYRNLYNQHAKIS